MKLFLEKVVPYIKHKKPEFRRAAAQCLHGLHSAAPEAFAARMRKRTAEEQREVTGVLAPLVPGFSIGGSADTAGGSVRKPSRKPPISGRGSINSGPEAAATVIQSIARGRRGRKLSKEMQRQGGGQGEEPGQRADAAPIAASTARTETSEAAAASQHSMRQHRAAQPAQQHQEQLQQPAEESRRQKQKPAVPRQKPAINARKPTAEPTTINRIVPGPSSAVKQQQGQAAGAPSAPQHPLFPNKPSPSVTDAERPEQPEEEAAQDEQLETSGAEDECQLPAATEPEAAHAHGLAMQNCAEEISRHADDEDTATLLIHLRQLCDLVTRSAAGELQRSLPDIFGPLRDCMDHKGVEVRKVVVRHR